MFGWFVVDNGVGKAQSWVSCLCVRTNKIKERSYLQVDSRKNVRFTTDQRMACRVLCNKNKRTHLNISTIPSKAPPNSRSVSVIIAMATPLSASAGHSVNQSASMEAGALPSAVELTNAVLSCAEHRPTSLHQAGRIPCMQRVRLTSTLNGSLARNTDEPWTFVKVH